MRSPLRHIEQFDDRTRCVRKLAENDGRRVAVKRPNFVERYVRGELHIVVRRTLPEQPEYGFLICAQPSGLGFDPHQIAPDLVGVTDDPEGSGVHRNIDKAAVLPFDVKLVEERERLVPSLIRFQRFDTRAFGRRESLYEFGSFVAPGEKFLRAPRDREIRFIWPRYAVAVSERSGENVKATADDIDVRAGLNVESARERAFFDRYYGIVCRWRWHILDVQINVDAQPIIDPFLEGWELGHGPLNAGLSV
jgi:hypothetical protein